MSERRGCHERRPRRDRRSVRRREPARIQAITADATRLPLPEGCVDAVICSAALLYMPVSAALTEWRRILRPGGVLGFSTMQADNPPSAALFRQLAADFGVHLRDPSAALGSVGACRDVLRTHGFEVRSIVPETVGFGASDLEQAWPIHARMYASELAGLSSKERTRLQTVYVRALTNPPVTDSPLDEAAVLYAFGTSLSSRL